MHNHTHYEYLIVGAGPAGLQLGYFLQKMHRSFLILEANDTPGTFYDSLPRHGKMISINKMYTGYSNPETQLRYDWNSLLCDEPTLQVPRYSQRYFPLIAEYKRYLIDFAQHYQLPISYSTRATYITKQNNIFTITDQRNHTYTAPRLIIATGIGYTPYIPPIPGLAELGEHYLDFPIDPESYKDQRVLIVGKGNAAFETANALVSTARIIHMCSPRPIKIAWETHFMGHVRAVNIEFLDTYFLKGQNSALNANIEKLERTPQGIVAHIVYTNARGQTMQLVYDRVLLCTGFRFDTSIFDPSCQPELVYNGKLPAMTHEWESTTVKDLYFAGTLMQMRDFQKTMSNVVHGFRFNIQFLSHLLAYKYHDESLPCTSLPLDASTLAQHILTRVSKSAALFLQPGFLCDLIVISPHTHQAHYYEHVPVDYAHASSLTTNYHYYTITLEYGHFTGNPLHSQRDPDPSQASQDSYIHPIIRHFHSTNTTHSQLIDSHHVPENLENNWLPTQHTLLLSTTLPGHATHEEMTNYKKNLQEYLQQHLVL